MMILSVRRARSPILKGLAGAASALLLGTSFAQTPDAGSLLREEREREERSRVPETDAAPLAEPAMRPPIRLPAGTTVKVSTFRVTGNRALPTEELKLAVASFEGRTLDVAGLNEATGTLTRLYQSRGYILSYAYLPVQKIDGGVVEIAIIEGRLGSTQVVTATDVRLDDTVVLAHFAGVGSAKAEESKEPARQADIDSGLVGFGDMPVEKPLVAGGDLAGSVQQADIERRLLLLNDIPGIVARGAFTPGAQPGESDLVISVVEEPPLAGSVEINNHGSQSTGEYRMGAQILLRNLFGVGDSTRANLAWSTRGALASGGLNTRVPVGGDGWVLSGGLSHLTYEVKGEFSSLGARGEADALQLGASYPMVRSQAGSFSFQTDYEHRELRDLIPLIASETRKTSRNASAGFSGDLNDRVLGGGRTRASAAWHFGQLDQPDGNDALGKRGAFKKGVFTLSRDQYLHTAGSLFLRVSAQEATFNLDSSEKLGLGGPYAVRAYAPGEAAVDRGYLATVEYRYRQAEMESVTVWRVFADTATGDTDFKPLDGTTNNRTSLHGAGLGMTWNDGDVEFSVNAAWRNHRRPSTGGDRLPRVFAQLTKSF